MFPLKHKRLKIVRYDIDTILLAVIAIIQLD